MLVVLHIKDSSNSLRVHHPDATTGLVAFGHFFLLSRVETVHAQYARGYKITKLCWHNAQCFEGSIMLEIMAGIIFAPLLPEAPELGTPHYKGQTVGSKRCLLSKGSKELVLCPLL